MQYTFLTGRFRSLWQPQGAGEDVQRSGAGIHGRSPSISPSGPALHSPTWLCAGARVRRLPHGLFTVCLPVELGHREAWAGDAGGAGW